MNLAEIRARAEAATPGPWVAPDLDDRESDWYFELVEPIVVTSDSTPGNYVAVARDICQGDDDGRADAEFIAHAREDVPALLAEIDRLDKRIDIDRLRELAGALNRMHAKHPLAFYTGFGDSILEAIGEEPGYMGKPLRFEGGGS